MDITNTGECSKAIKSNRQGNQKRFKNEKKLEILKKDQNVTIITREFLNNYTSSVQGPICPPPLRSDDFPSLGLKVKPPLKPQHNSQPSNQPSLSKRSRSGPIKVDLIDILKKPELQAPPKNKEVKLYAGNILDSSKPERKVGKHREQPKKKKLTPLKLSILNDCSNPTYTEPHSPNFEIYCDNIVTEDLDKPVELLISEIVKYQEKLYKRDPIRGAAKRRYTVGFHAVRKYLGLNKMKLIIIAPNIRVGSDNGLLYSTINELKTLANASDIPYIFASSRRKLGRIVLKYIPITCVGIMDYSGAEELFKHVLGLITSARYSYEQLYPKKNEEETTEIKELTENFIAALK